MLIHDNTVATHLFYIAQEAVQNAIKHGAAKRITIDLSAEEDLITLEIADNGRGFREDVPTKGMGLRIMHHRANMIGAAFQVKSNPPEGVVAKCSVRVLIGKEATGGKSQS